MNRYATFGVLVLAAFALSTIQSAPHSDDALEESEQATQFSLSTSDEDETASVKAAKLGLFNDFCLSSRDYVLSDIKAKTGQLSSQGFSAFFNIAEDVANKALEASQEATSRLSKQLANPNTPVDGDDQVAAAQRQIAGQSQPMALLSAIRGAITVTINTVSGVVAQTVEEAKRNLGVERFITIAKGGCMQAAEYENELKRQFEEFKSGMPEKAKAQFAKLGMEAIPCTTASRIVNANAICDLISVARDPSAKLLSGFLNRKAVAEATAESD